MHPVVFDFDSTLIDRESLDELLGRLLDDHPERAAEVRRIDWEFRPSPEAHGG